MPKKSEAVELRIVAHTNNLSTEERQWVDDACEKLGFSQRDITGVCFIDGDRLMVLQLTDGTMKVEDLSNYKQEEDDNE